eukprot:6045899-Ditylum_brightwellii.AAC.1
MEHEKKINTTDMANAALRTIQQEETILTHVKCAAGEEHCTSMPKMEKKSDWVGVNDSSASNLDAKDKAVADLDNIYSEISTLPEKAFSSCGNAVRDINWFVSMHGDLYRKY